MPKLVPPDPSYHHSFVPAIAEESDPVHLHPGSVVDLDDPVRFAEYVAALRADADPSAPRPPGYVPETMLWWVEGETYLGRVSVRHALTDALRTVGGHMATGFDPVPADTGTDGPPFVPRSRWRPRWARSRAADLRRGQPRVRRIIEGAGGVFEDQVGPKRRYWVPTRRSAAARPDGRHGLTGLSIPEADR